MVFLLFMSQSKKGYSLNLVKCLAEAEAHRKELLKLTSVGKQILKLATWVGLERYECIVLQYKLNIHIFLQGTCQ